MLVVCNNARMLLAVMCVRGTQEEAFVRSRYLLCSSFMLYIYSSAAATFTRKIVIPITLDFT